MRIGKVVLACTAAAVLLLIGGRSPAQPPGAGELKTMRGTIKSFTTAPRGEVDGAVLDDGTVIHWPPHLEDQFTKIASRGDRVKVTGRMETGPEGDTHLEVQTLTNIASGASVENDGPPPPRGAKPREAGPRRAADREQRLRDLENQLDQLRREIDRLRRER